MPPYCVVTPKPVDDQIGSVKVERGVDNQVEVEYTLPDNLLIPKGSEEKLEQSVTLQESVEAPVELGQELGKVIITLDGEEIGSYPLTAKKAVERMTFGKAMERLFKSMVQMKAVFHKPLPSLSPPARTENMLLQGGDAEENPVVPS